MNAVTDEGRPLLMERDPQLARLTELLDAGKGRIAVVSGPVAVGKTLLLDTFTHRVSGGARVLTATASRTERDLPMEVVRQLFAAADPPQQAAARFARLLDLAGTAPGPVPIEVLHGVCLELLALADRPLVVAVDDVHHADAPSLDCLLYFARRLRTAPVLLLLTDCALPQRAHPLFHAELQRQPHFHGVRLRPLSEAGVASLLAAHLDLRTADHVAADVHRVTGGSPLLVRALVDDHLTNGWSDPEGRTLAPGDAFAQAVQSLLYRCDPSVPDVARALAVLDAPASAERVAVLLGRETRAVARAMSALGATGLVH
ncbi:MAG TPA: ATP-binding protein, partial [Thermomonospora sp.]|nr:ATP-binding protein [Thermomonospora sp.]